MLEVSTEARRVSERDILKDRLFYTLDFGSNIVLEDENILVNTDNGFRMKMPSPKSIMVAVYNREDGEPKIKKYPELLDFTKVCWDFLLPKHDKYAATLRGDYEKLEAFLLEVIGEMVKRRIKMCTPYWWPEMIEIPKDETNYIL